ncbi:DUF4153 domain-containing protein [Mesobacillus harenae]|uniref:DUF4153 domain-containing protein n=1 Tax=Mesobacillus harenae TaxID=2213203 RepID=UPI001580D028|nr:DUF4173 domain-containing protein [Mesobacillus harenae]
MNIQLTKEDKIFFILCLVLGIVAEQSFFHGRIGVSYLVFIASFYSVFYWKYRKFSFFNKKMGLLLFMCIWALSTGFLLYSNLILYVINSFIIPCLVIFHIIIITTKFPASWHSFAFAESTLRKLAEGIKYSFAFLSLGPNRIKNGLNEEARQIVKRIVIGLGISVPLLFVIIQLLISADGQFEQVLGSLPNWIAGLQLGDELFRLAVIFSYTLGFFGLLQVLSRRAQLPATVKLDISIIWDSVIVLTVLVLLNLVYGLFTIVQFRYFFGEALQSGYTYAQYARRGFFELLIVTVFNLSILTAALSFVKEQNKGIKLFIKLLLTLLVLFSGVMLYSAVIRLLMYEESYGFTFLRVLAHSFMIFLMIILAYTLARVWLERLSLRHFYIISALLYYSVINIVNIDQFVVDRNMNRYEQTGKIDVSYLNSLSYEGVAGLADLYKQDKRVPMLGGILRERKQEFENSHENWQSYNFSRQRAFEKLESLDLE